MEETIPIILCPSLILKQSPFDELSLNMDANISKVSLMYQSKAILALIKLIQRIEVTFDKKVDELKEKDISNFKKNLFDLNDQGTLTININNIERKVYPLLQFFIASRLL